ncbi:MAG: hypothetical protein DRO93_01970 [Candidatus Thorarchaeota archaeon]|nr:MAG: hypothetical protein DRO93_01970 [Candidatus Thorarchaeota archaeon]
MVQAYLSGPIIHDDLRRDEFYHVVVDTLEKNGVTVFAPQFLPKASPREIYLRDVREVRVSDFLVAEVSNPSLGVGMEIMLAIELVIPVLLFRHTQSKPLSHMVRGADGKVLFEYETMDDVRRILNGITYDSLIVHPCPSCDSQVAEVDEEGLRCVGCGNRFTVE